jgi:hypothetical protein
LTTAAKSSFDPSTNELTYIVDIGLIGAIKAGLITDTSARVEFYDSWLTLIISE